MSPDLVIRNARLRSGKLSDIAIAGGRIEKISDKAVGSAEKMVDAQGRMVTETFVVGHLHLDKVMTGALRKKPYWLSTKGRLWAVR